MIFNVNVYGDDRRLSPRLEFYEVEDYMGDRLPAVAVCLDEVDDKGNIGEHFDTITTSFGDLVSVKNAAYIDTNNCPYAENMLAKSGIARNLGMTRQSGFCEYPLYQFDEGFLRELDADKYDAYSDIMDTYRKQFTGEVEHGAATVMWENYVAALRDGEEQIEQSLTEHVFVSEKEPVQRACGKSVGRELPVGGIFDETVEEEHDFFAGF